MTSRFCLLAAARSLPALLIAFTAGASTTPGVSGGEIAVTAPPSAEIVVEERSTTPDERQPAAPAPITFTGRVLQPDGTPAAGAVVVTTAGGQAVSDATGAFEISVEVPEDSTNLRVTALLSAGSSSLAASLPILPIASARVTPVGDLRLSASAACQPEWVPTFGDYPGTNGTVRAMAVFDDGSGPALYVGGEFTSAGGVLANRIARWDGVRWSALGSGLSGTVWALAVHDDGSGPALFAGGEFTNSGGVGASWVARWRGGAWSTVSGLIGSVYALAVYDDGTGPALYAGGAFSSGDPSAPNRIARWNGSTWSWPNRGVDGDVVRTLAVYDDGSGPSLYVGGGFSTVGGGSLIPGGANANRIARWNAAGWSTLGSGVNNGVSNTVLAIAVYDDGDGEALYVGGTFASAGGVSAGRIAKWDGVTWSPLVNVANGANGVDGIVRVLAVCSDGSGPQLCVGGEFLSVGSISHARVARWNGATWTGLGGNPNQAVHAVAEFDSGDGPSICVGGAFSVVGNLPALTIARSRGSSWSVVGSGLNNWVYALTVHDDGGGPALYAGGQFAVAGGRVVNRVVKWEGAHWLPLGSGVAGGQVRALHSFDDGSGNALYVGGGFSTAGGVPASCIARWDGTSWSSLGAGMNGAVHALESYDDGNGMALYAGGAFQVAGGVTVNYVAKWNGTQWSALDNGVVGGSGGVWALEAYDDGHGMRLYAGGGFSTAGGLNASRIARWDGTSWSSLGTGMNEAVHALTSYDDGNGPALYAAGAFNVAGGVPAGGVARWDGQNWSSLGIGVPGNVYALSAFDDGGGLQLFAGGVFDVAGGVSASRIAKWDGLGWSPLGLGLPSSVFVLAVHDAGSGPSLCAGGSFNTSSTGDSYIARWQGCPPRPDLALVPTSVDVPADGVASQPFQVRWTATNPSTEPLAGSWHDEVSFSTPVQLADGSAPATAFEVAGPQGLAAGASYERAMTFLMPSVPGTFDVHVRADANDAVDESNEANNEAGPFPITVGAPNLRAEITGAPSGTLVAGSTSAVSFRVWNDGNGPTTAPHWTDRVYAVFDSDGVPRAVRSLPNPASLLADPGGDGSAIGASYARSNEAFVLPPGLYGSCRLRLHTDVATEGAPGGALVEISETDNVVESAPFVVIEPDRPNLVVDQQLVQLAGAIPGTQLPGAQFQTAAWRLANASTLADFLGGSLRTEIWLSDVPGLAGPDPLAGAQLLAAFTESVPPIARGTTLDVPRTRQVLVPSLPDGSGPYTFKVRINADGALDEDDQGGTPYFDNLGASGEFPITFTGTYELAPNVAQPIAPVGAGLVGHPLTFTWNVQNLGRPDWPVQQAWRDDVWLSADDQLDGPGVDVLMGSFTTTSVQLSPGGSWVLPVNDGYVRSGSAVVPAGLTSGTYRLLLQTDAGGAVAEISGAGEANNVQVSAPFVVGDLPADLAIAADLGGGAPPAQGAPGQSFQLAWTVANASATGVTNVTSWTDRVVLSSSATALVSPSVLATVPHAGALGPGSSYAVTRVVTIPNNVVPAARWLHFVTDVNGQVHEGGTLANNRDVLPFQVVAGGADLVVEHVAADEVARPGGAITATWRVGNAGTEATFASSWNDHVFLASTPALGTGSVVPLGTWPRSSALAAGSTYTSARTFPIPAGLSPGAWYVVVLADGGGHASEAEETNNTRATRTVLELEPPPPGGGGGGGGGPTWLPANLVASNVLFGSATVTGGQELAVSWTVDNAGLGATSTGTWSDAVYLSTDALVSADDVPLGVYTHAEVLAPGESRLVNAVPFVVPLGTSGARFVLVRVDPGNGVYQAGATADDVASSAELVSILAPPPTNLTLTDVTIPAQASLGESLAVTWTVANDSATPIPAAWSWSEGFWLVPDGGTIASPDARFLGSLASSAGALRGSAHTQQSPPGALSVPGVFPGVYRVHARTDVLGQIAESDESLADNLRVSTGAVDLRAIPLALPAGSGTPGAAAAALPNGASRWFEVTSPSGTAPDEGLTIDLEFVHDDLDAGCELFARSGSVPVLGQYDVASDGLESIDPHRQVLRVPRTTGERLFVLARAVQGVGATTSATLSATERPFEVEAVSPPRVGAGIVTLAVHGAQLWRAGAADGVEIQSASQSETRRSLETRILADGTLLARFDLTGFVLGAASVRAYDGTQAAAGSAEVTVDPASPLAVEAALVVPPSIRRGEEGAAILRLVNAGNVDVPFAYAQVGHAHAMGMASAAERVVLDSPDQVSGSGPDPVVRSAQRSAVTALVEALGPGRSAEIGIEILVGGDFASPGAALSVAARADTTASFTAGVLPRLAEALRSAAAQDPATPPQWSALVLDPTAWSAAIASAYAAGDITLGSAPIHDGSAPISVLEALGAIAEGIASHVALPGGVALPQSAVRTAFDALSCEVLTNVPTECDSLDVHDCAGGVTTALANALAGNALPVATACVATPEPTDPNDKLGPTGIGPNRIVSANQALQYEVRFENLEGATAWASRISILDPLAPTFRSSSVRFESVRIGTNVFTFPPNTAGYVGQVPLTIGASTSVTCQISALVNAATDTIEVVLQAIDPATGLPGSAADFGLLPPNGPGFEDLATGSLRFRVSTREPEAALIVASRSGLVQRNSARTQLNLSPPFHTNTTENVLDDGAPGSGLVVTELAPGELLLEWSADDVEELAAGDFPGTGVASFTLSRAPTPDGPWTPIVADTAAASIEIAESPGATVSFKVEARDLAGNRESKLEADATVVLASDCDADGVADAAQILADPGLDLNGNGVLDACECRAVNYCTPGSHGATISIVGVPSVGLNQFGLHATGATPNVPGVFFYGTASQQVPLGGGFLCVTGNVVRLYPAQATSAAGSLTRMLDFTTPPVGSGPGAIASGATRHFQFWYRDSMGGGAFGGNASDAISVTFCE